MPSKSAGLSDHSTPLDLALAFTKNIVLQNSLSVKVSLTVCIKPLSLINHGEFYPIFPALAVK